MAKITKPKAADESANVVKLNVEGVDLDDQPIVNVVTLEGDQVVAEVRGDDPSGEHDYFTSELPEEGSESEMEVDLSVLGEREMGQDLPNPLLGMKGALAVADSGPKWTAEKALVHFKGKTTEELKLGAITLKEKEEWDTLAGTLETHYDVFSFQAAVLFFLRDRAYDRASRNFERLGNIPTYGYWDANKDWMACILRVAKLKFAEGYSVAFPGQPGFVPQTLTNDDRDELFLRIHQLVLVAEVATCQNCGEWVGFAKDGQPFTECKECRKAEQKAKELRELNEKLAVKNKLLQPLEGQLTELYAAGSWWVADQVRLGRNKAQIALDNEFKAQTEWLAKQLAELWISVKVTEVTDMDRAKIEKLAGYIADEIEKVRVFKHNTWCSCGAPTYKWKHPKTHKAMEAGLKCEDCRHAENQKVVKTGTQTDLPMEEKVEVADLAAKYGVTVQLADEQFGEGLKRFNKRQAAAERERERNNRQ